MNGIAPEPYSSAIARRMVVDANDAKAECLNLESPRRMRPNSTTECSAVSFRSQEIFTLGFGASHPQELPGCVWRHSKSLVRCSMLE